MQPDTTNTLDDTGETNATVKVDTATNKLTIRYGDNKCIKITLGTAITTATATVRYGHIFTETFDMSKVRWEIISPTLMVIVGIVFLLVTIFPPVIIAVLRLKAKAWSPQHHRGPSGWGKWTQYTYGTDNTTVHAYLWHLFDILMIIKISLAAIFID